MWNHAKSLGVTRIAFVGGIDHERADFAAAVESLKAMGANPAVLTLPIGSGADFRGVVDLVAMQAFTRDGPGDIPDDLADAAAAARESLVESVAECDDGLLEKYLEEVNSPRTRSCAAWSRARARARSCRCCAGPRAL